MKVCKVTSELWCEIQAWHEVCFWLYNGSNRLTRAILVFDNELDILKPGDKSINLGVSHYLEVFRLLVEFASRNLKKILNTKRNENNKSREILIETCQSLNTEYELVENSDRARIEFFLLKIDKLFDLCICLKCIFGNHFFSGGRGAQEVDEYNSRKIEFLPLNPAEILMYTGDGANLKIEKWFRHNLNMFSMPLSQNEDELKVKFDKFYDFIFDDEDNQIFIVFRGLIVKVFDDVISPYAAQANAN